MPALATRQQLYIHISDDDPDDRLMIKDALDEVDINKILSFTEDGQDLLDYLKRHGKYITEKGNPLPGIIFLDLNMPRKDGREALHAIKQDPELQHIPIVVLTTSSADEDITFTYALGGNSFIVKPNSYQKLVDVIQTVMRYWFDVVRLP